jgi:hypothetical protein
MLDARNVGYVLISVLPIKEIDQEPRECYFDYSYNNREFFEPLAEIFLIQPCTRNMEGSGMA